MNNGLSKTSITDRLLEILGVAGMLLLVALPAFFFNKLPDSIPVHFNITGEPDSYGSRNTIWMLPAIGFFLFLTIVFIPKILINYGNTDFNETVKKNIFIKAVRMLRIVNMLTVFMFSSIVYYTILLSLEKPTGFWRYSTLFFLILIFLVVVYFLIIIRKNKK